jgi:ABC-type multidrug transport system fused ATPase/permease subunit
MMELGRRIWPFFRKFAAKYSVAMLLLVFTGLLSLLPPYLVKILIDSGVKAGRISVVDGVAVLLLLFTLVSGLTRGLMDYIHEWVSARFIMALRAELFSRVLKQPLRFFSEVKIGDILSRLRSDTTSVYGVLVNTFIGALGELVQIVGIAGFLLYLNWKLALIALSFVPLLHIIFRYFSKPLRQMALDVRDKDVSVLDFLQERIANVQLIKLYHREEREEENHARWSQEYVDSILASVRLRFVSIFVIGVLTSGASIVVIWYGGHEVLRGTLSVGSLFAFYLYTVRLYSPIQSLTNRIVEIYSSLASVQRIAEFLDLVPSIAEPIKPKLLQGPVIGHLTFRNISFGYPSGEKPVLHNFNLNIYPGQKVALVGASGAGKTTLVNLVGRLYDVTDGAIELDSIDIRRLRFQDLYDSIGFVPQETFLFDATIEENIRYGREDCSLNEVIEASQIAYLHDFVDTLPQKYQTIIGPRGASLSGGQRQRLALARLVLKNAPIWVLDEFTSALDSRSESIVHANLLPLLQQKTAIIIAHRHSTIRMADLVVVIDEGQIKEIGNHDELYSRQGLYRKLFDTQLAADDICA